MSKELGYFKKIRQAILEEFTLGGTYKFDELNAIEQALKRNEPMKPTRLPPLKSLIIHTCPNCLHIVDNHYCSDCGQKIDWSDDSE